MRKIVEINDKVKLIMTQGESSYSEVLEDMERAEYIRIVTYNISKNIAGLINKLKSYQVIKIL
ncbi:hypothetical protein Q5M85_21200 [Paraclostridium bifermentans]|nr:hypothetical protein [Paraclostridium bifermentans]